MNKIELQTISKSYGNTLVLDHINFQIKDKERIAILGPSGCGKSTLLNIISGLETQSNGRIMRRSTNISYMFQKDNLLPWLTVEENILFGLKLLKKDTFLYEEKLNTYLEAFHLENSNSKYPKELSGGMKQRVSLIRALITNPDILVLDEPFSALDYKTKLNIEKETLQNIKETQTTSILVTHNSKEAIYFADRIIILSNKPTHIKKILINTKEESLEKEIEELLDEA